jgi:uncharacterized NAD(P)/FAD-binding protein YdhS
MTAGFNSTDHTLATNSLDEDLTMTPVHSLSSPLMPGDVLDDERSNIFTQSTPADTNVIAIVGGGFSGAMALANLLRLGNKSNMRLHIVLIDRQSSVGEGIAYRTKDERHLLNVPASRMSAWVDAPGDFLDFAKAKDPAVTGYDFLPRRVYGEYVQQTLVKQVQMAGEHLSTIILHDEVTRMTQSSSSAWVIQTKGGRRIRADIVVLAVGHRPPDDPLEKKWKGERTRFIGNPWETPALNQISPREPVLLIGGGLTAIDVLLTLNRPDRTSPLFTISPHGLMPKTHLPQPIDAGNVSELLRDWLDPAQSLTIRRIVSTLRCSIDVAAKSGVAWQQVVDALRGTLPTVWQRLAVGERARFLRHVRPFWEVHRHRIAPSVADVMDRMRDEQVLRVMVGLVVAARADEKGVDVTIRHRDTSRLEELRVAWVVNCTGPSVHGPHRTHGFLGPLLKNGTLCNDDLGLGLLTDLSGRAVTMHGDIHPNLLVAGTLRKATLWESTAVPELREQASVVASMALSTLSRRRQSVD